MCNHHRSVSVAVLLFAMTKCYMHSQEVTVTNMQDAVETAAVVAASAVAATQPFLKVNIFEGRSAHINFSVPV